MVIEYGEFDPVRFYDGNNRATVLPTLEFKLDPILAADTRIGLNFFSKLGSPLFSCKKRDFQDLEGHRKFAFGGKVISKDQAYLGHIYIPEKIGLTRCTLHAAMFPSRQKGREITAEDIKRTMVLPLMTRVVESFPQKVIENLSDMELLTPDNRKSTLIAKLHEESRKIMETNRVEISETLPYGLTNVVKLSNGVTGDIGSLLDSGYQLGEIAQMRA